MEEELQMNDTGKEPETPLENSTECTPEKIVAGAKIDHESDTPAGPQGPVSISTGVQGTGLPEVREVRKKLSGAQQRKLNRERKIAAGIWTKEKPKSNGANEKAPERGVVNSGFREEAKRPRDDFRSPSYPSKRPRTVPWTGTYKETASDLQMAIIDKRHPDFTLDRGQVELIQEHLVDAVDNTPTECENPPQFTRTSFSAGVLWMTCANEGTKKWLMDTIETMEGLWKGAEVTAVASRDLPKRPKVLVFIPGQEEAEEKTRSRLGRQNPGLRVEGWLVLNRKVERDGVIIAYSIDKASFDALEAKQNRAFYKLGTVVFRTLGRSYGDRGFMGEPSGH